MPFEKDRLIYVNLTSTVKETNELIETTLEDKAKEYNVYDPTRKYRKKLVAIGESWVLEGLDKKLGEMALGEKTAMEIPPESAFGIWDPAKLKIVPLRRFGERAPQLKVGDEVELDNRVGHVKLIGSGRVHLDFNHKYAGKTIKYDVEILEEVKEDLEKARALFARRIPVDEEKIKCTMQEGVLTYDIPEEIYLEEGLQIVKKALSNDAFKFLPNIAKVIFQEAYENQSKVEKKEETEQPPATQQ